MRGARHAPTHWLAATALLAAGLHAAGCSRVTGGGTSEAAASHAASERAGSADPKQTLRLADGHPDLNGTWDNGSGFDGLNPQKLQGGSVCVEGCEAESGAAAQAQPVAAPSEEPARNFPHYRQQFLPKVKDLDEHQLEFDPVLRCRSPGVPRIGPPDKIVQTPAQVVFLYDDVSGSFWRIVPTDGRPHRTDVEDSTMGDAVGHWEGDTLVVESTHFSDDTWLTDNGALHSSDMRVTERLHRLGDTLQWQAVVEDPKVLAEPWHATPRVAKLTPSELVEPTPCVDQDIVHAVDSSHHDNPR